MPGQDGDLLARLNALKPSSVKLEPAAVRSIDVQTSQPQTLEDKLAERLKTLRSGRTPAPIDTPKRVQALVSPEVRVVEPAQGEGELSLEQDPIRNWQQQDGNEQSVNDLLAEIEADGQWRLGPEEPKSVQALLKEAKDALPKHDEPSIDVTPGDHDDGEHGRHEDTHDHMSKKTADQHDEEETDDYIARVLAELEIEKKYGGCDEDESAQESISQGAAALRNGIDLPSTPSHLKELPSSSDYGPPTYEDSELEARFSKLGMGILGLPSTPTSAPSSKPKVMASLTPKNKTNMPTYTDEDVDSWCCICNEDGELRCLGCDGDLYCHNCWSDGHGAGPGKEKGHKAVQFNRKPPRAAAA